MTTVQFSTVFCLCLIQSFCFQTLGLVFNIPPPVDPFLGRAEILDKLQNLLLNQSNSADFKPYHGVALYGPSGIGKRQVALKFIQQLQQNSNPGSKNEVAEENSKSLPNFKNFIWLNVHNKKSLEDSFININSQLQLELENTKRNTNTNSSLDMKIKDIGKNPGDMEEIIKDVYKNIYRELSLFVINLNLQTTTTYNLNVTAFLRPFLPREIPAVTSKGEKSHPPFFIFILHSKKPLEKLQLKNKVNSTLLPMSNLVEVPKLDEEESISLVLHRLRRNRIRNIATWPPPPENKELRDEVKSLVEVLEGNPLVIHQALALFTLEQNEPQDSEGIVETVEEAEKQGNSDSETKEIQEFGQEIKELQMKHIYGQMGDPRARMGMGMGMGMGSRGRGRGQRGLDMPGSRGKKRGRRGRRGRKSRSKRGLGEDPEDPDDYGMGMGGMGMGGMGMGGMGYPGDRQKKPPKPKPAIQLVFSMIKEYIKELDDPESESGSLQRQAGAVPISSAVVMEILETLALLPSANEHPGIRLEFLMEILNEVEDEELDAVEKIRIMKSLSVLQDLGLISLKNVSDPFTSNLNINKPKFLSLEMHRETQKVVLKTLNEKPNEDGHDGRRGRRPPRYPDPEEEEEIDYERPPLLDTENIDADFDAGDQNDSDSSEETDVEQITPKPMPTTTTTTKPPKVRKRSILSKPRPRFSHRQNRDRLTSHLDFLLEQCERILEKIQIPAPILVQTPQNNQNQHQNQSKSQNESQQQNQNQSKTSSESVALEKPQKIHKNFDPDYSLMNLELILEKLEKVRPRHFDLLRIIELRTKMASSGKILQDRRHALALWRQTFKSVKKLNGFQDDKRAQQRVTTIINIVKGLEPKEMALEIEELGLSILSESARFTSEILKNLGLNPKPKKQPKKIEPKKNVGEEHDEWREMRDEL